MIPTTMIRTLALVLLLSTASPVWAEEARSRYLVTTYTQTVLTYLWLDPAELDAVIALLHKIKTSPRYYESFRLGDGVTYVTVSAYEEETP